MKTYALISDGFVVGSGAFDSTPGNGWVDVGDKDVPPMTLFKVAYRNGEFIQTSEKWFNPSVQQVRAHEYPSVGDQLGAIWKAIAPLIEHPEAEAILARIQAVKDANPKPSN